MINFIPSKYGDSNPNWSYIRHIPSSSLRYKNKIWERKKWDKNRINSWGPNKFRLILESMFSSSYSPYFYVNSRNIMLFLLILTKIVWFLSTNAFKKVKISTGLNFFNRGQIFPQNWTKFCQELATRLTLIIIHNSSLSYLSLSSL